ncbi:MAG: indole-3-glycerol phosphate synthase TrpC [Pirellulaceae bacterium]
MNNATTILDKIVAVKRQEIAAAQQLRPLREVQAAAQDAPPVRDFQRALAAAGPLKLIAEIKKASPSKGVIRQDFQPLEIADIYARHGATCLSVLTDRQFFQGGLEILQAVRQRVEIPVLRKDFILDPYQVVEARAAGADAVLLIAECLEDDELQQLFDAIESLEMTALVEFYEPQHLERILAVGATLVGVNNRDLRTFTTDLEHTIRLRPQIPAHCVVVGESGIHTRQDVLRLERAGVQAMLVGEQLMAAADIGLAVRTLLGTERPA